MDRQRAPSHPQSRPIAFLIFIGVLPLLLNGLYNPKLAQEPSSYWTVEFLTWILIPAFLYWLGRSRKWFTHQDLGFHTQIAGTRSPGLFVACLLLVTVLDPVIYHLTTMLSRVLIRPELGRIPFDYDMLVPQRGLAKVLVAAHFSLSAGIVEEIYFRGMFRTLFSPSRRGACAFILVSSVGFALIHWEGGFAKLFSTFLFSVAISGIYACIGNIWPLITGHVLTDYLWLG